MDLTITAAIIIALITSLIGPSTLEWIKFRFRKNPKNNSVKEAININELIDHQLGMIMDETEYDRIWLLQFHNGGNFYPTGKSIQKFSIFYERITPNVSPIQHIFQNIPVSLFPKTFSTLYNHGKININNINTYKNEDCDLLLSCTDDNTKVFNMVPLYSLENNFIGAIAMSCNKEIKLTEENWNFINNKVSVIGALLSEYLYKKK